MSSKPEFIAAAAQNGVSTDRRTVGGSQFDSDDESDESEKIDDDQPELSKDKFDGIVEEDVEEESIPVEEVGDVETPLESRAPLWKRLETRIPPRPNPGGSCKAKEQ